MHSPASHAFSTRPDPWAGCGWYESSLELAQGAEATEIVRPEALAALLPAEWRLDWQLRGLGSTAMA
jgi:hypothetical protein